MNALLSGVPPSGEMRIIGEKCVQANVVVVTVLAILLASA